MVFQLCGIKILVSNNELVGFICFASHKYKFYLFQLMKIGQKILGKKLFAALMKQTFYGQFVGGEVRYFSSLHINNISSSLSLLERPDHRPDHRQNEKLRSQEHPGLQRRGGPLPGGRRGHRDGVSS